MGLLRSGVRRFAVVPFTVLARFTRTASGGMTLGSVREDWAREHHAKSVDERAAATLEKGGSVRRLPPAPRAERDAR